VSGDSKRWRWTPDRLRQLADLLKKPAGRDAKGYFFGTLGLKSYVARNCRDAGLDLSYNQADSGLRILVFLGVLEPGGHGGVKRSNCGYTRRFYPEKLDSITDADIRRYWQSLR
jgi:hypothetical protein